MTCAISKNGYFIVSGDFSKTIMIFCILSNKIVRLLKGHIREVTSIALKDNCNQIVSRSYDKTIRIWNF